MQIVKKRSVLGQVLLGGSVPILMLTTFAAHSLYGMIGTFVCIYVKRAVGCSRAWHDCLLSFTSAWDH
ncbi:DUF2339 domain-containing protein [Priestia flexa]|nr:DUF2339 domain-containing protein [Priestia flexa]